MSSLLSSFPGTIQLPLQFVDPEPPFFLTHVPSYDGLGEVFIYKFEFPPRRFTLLFFQDSVGFNVEDFLCF